MRAQTWRCPAASHVCAAQSTVNRIRPARCRIFHHVQTGRIPVLNPDGGLDVTADLANQTSAQLAELTESYQTNGVTYTYGRSACCTPTFA